MNPRRVIVLSLMNAALQCSLFAQISGRVYERLSNPVKDGKVKISRVIVMPTRATLAEEGLKGGEGMTKEGDELAAKFTQEIEQLARSSGLEVISSPFTGQLNDELRVALVRLQNQYDEVHRQIDWNTDAKTPWGRAAAIRGASRRMNEGRAKIAEDALLGDSIAGADALIFPRISGTVKTGGKRASGGLVGWLEKSEVSYDMAFIARQTGEVLALYSVWHSSSLQKQVEKPVLGSLEKRIQKALLERKGKR